MVAHLFFFSEDESSLNKTPKAITGPEQQLLESMVLEENIGEEFCRDGPLIVKQNMNQPLVSKRKQREKERGDGRRTKDNNVKRGKDEEVQEGNSSPPNACLRCSGCLRGKGCKKVYKWRRMHK